ncbi:protein LAZY 1 [Morus notabilis]|nr:protein LAZY 1 [Morus notabilis]
MKILEWMHHKFRHNSIKPFKDLNIGNSCMRLSVQTSLDDQDPYTKPNYGSRDGFNSMKQPKQEEEKYFCQFEAKKEEETSAVISELFHGFLTIGTLGSDASINEPETPTFATPSENITDGRIKVTENHLKLINYELEKFLEAESKEEEGSDESSARNSNVSAITLGGKQMERAKDEDYWKTKVCPLQGYLFGSSIELPEERIEFKKEKASLGELFHRTKIAAENCTEKRPIEEIPEKQKHKSAMRFVKKMIKKVNPSSKSSYHSYGETPDSVSTKKELGDAIDSVSNMKKLQKVMRMFHRKIHPESSMAEREFVRSKKCKSKNTPKEVGCASGNLIHLSGDNKRFPQGSMSMEGVHCSKKNVNSPQESSLNCNNLRGKGEHWIKIDDDYLVLELQQQKL